MTLTLEIIVLMLVFVFGASIGSFLNVVICRLPEGQSVVRPRSRCPRCGKLIRWYDNMPLISWVLLGAKCRHCKEPISIQYPLVELIVATLAITCYFRFGFSLSFVFYFAFLSSLVTVSFIDIPYQIIPNEISIPGIAVGLLAGVLTPVITWQDSAIGAVMGFGLIALIAYGYYFLTKREGMGMGDAKLLGMIGAFLGWQSIPFVLLAASVQGLIVALIAIAMGAMKKAPPLPDPDNPEEVRLAEESEGTETPLRLAAVPFGPFLSLGAMEFFFFGRMLMNHIYGFSY